MARHLTVYHYIDGRQIESNQFEYVVIADPGEPETIKLDIYMSSKQLDDLQWTRCEDSPPPESGQYIVTEEKYGKNYIAIRKFSTNLSEVSSDDFSEGQSGWYNYSESNGYWKLDNIIAWRPPILPFNPD